MYIMICGEPPYKASDLKTHSDVYPQLKLTPIDFDREPWCASLNFCLSLREFVSIRILDTVDIQ